MSQFRPRLQPLEGRAAPATLAVTFSPATHTLTVVGTDGANEVTVQPDPADPTHFFLSSPTDRFPGGGTTFATPGGVHTLSFRMRAGDDAVFLGGPGFRLRGSLAVDGGDGANRVGAANLAVGRDLTVRNGTNTAGSDTATFAGVTVGGSLTIANGDGNTSTVIEPIGLGTSTVRGSVRITNGSGSDTHVIENLNVGGGVTIRNGLPDALGSAGFTQFGSKGARSTRLQVRGSVLVSYLGGRLNGPDEVRDLEVGGNVAFSYGTGEGALEVDGGGTGQPVLIHGSLGVTGTGRTEVAVGSTGQRTGLVVGKTFTVATGAAGAAVTLNRLTVFGATTLTLRGGANAVTIDDALFNGAFNLATGAGADAVRLDTAAGTTAGTSFGRAVHMSLGAGVDSLTLAGPNDAGQAVLFAGPVVVRHGAEGEVPTRFGKELYPFGGDLQFVV